MALEFTLYIAAIEDTVKIATVCWVIHCDDISASTSCHWT